jgi:hypothetical protein
MCIDYNYLLYRFTKDVLVVMRHYERTKERPSEYQCLATGFRVKSNSFHSQVQRAMTASHKGQ